MQDRIQGEDSFFKGINMPPSRKLRSRWKTRRLLMTAALMFTSGFTIIGFSLIQYLNQPKGEQARTLNPDVMEERAAIKDWAGELLRYDSTVEVNPLAARPGYLQSLALDYGSRLRAELKRQLASDTHPCSRNNQTPESCAALSESSVDKILYSALQGHKYFLADQDPTGAIRIVSPLDQTQVIAVSEFKKMALEAAVSPVNLTPSVDPYRVDRSRNRVMKVRITRLGNQVSTDAAQQLRDISLALKSIDKQPPAK